MKRLQFRHQDNIFENREGALNFFKNIVDNTNTASTLFGNSLYAEPMVAKYKDYDGNIQILFAIGVDNTNTPYHIIDSKEIYELICKNEENIFSEIERAKKSEEELNNIINNEINRAISSESNLQEQININKNTIVSVERSGENILEEYALKNSIGEIQGETIKIYKDSSLVGALTGFKGAKSVEIKDNSFILTYDEDIRDENVEYLYLIYRNEIGELKLVGIDFENFLMESEFGYGIKVVDHIASIKIKNNEKYINVNEEGLYTTGIDETINKSINDLNTSIKEEINTVSETLNNNIILLDENLNKIIENKENELKNEILSNKINSKDVILKENNTGTTLEIQTDEITITKKANANTIYDTNIAVLGTLLKVKKVESDNTSIKSRYELQGSDGKLIGDPIEINVESALVDFRQGKMGASVNPQTGTYTEGTGDITMDFIYRLENGTYKLVQIEISKYFTDAHFGKGLNNQDGVISLKEGGANEYLVINENTIEVVGVNNAIFNAKNEAINTAVSNSNSYTDTKAKDLTSYVTTSIENAVNTLNENVKLESERAIAAENSLSKQINNEVSNRENAIISVISSTNEIISEEITNRNNAISEVKVLLNNEITNRTNEDEKLRNEIISSKEEIINIAINSATTVAKDIAVEEIAKIVDGADSSLDTLKEIGDWIKNDTTGSAQMANDIEKLKIDINILNGDKNTSGSVARSVVDGIGDTLIINNLPVDVITLDDAFRNGSLLRKVLNGGNTYYYVSNKANEMYYVKEDGSNVVLNDYITNLNNENIILKNKIGILETEIETLKNKSSVDAEQVKNIIKEYLEGVTNEISIKPENDKLKIGFADDAIFG